VKAEPVAVLGCCALTDLHELFNGLLPETRRSHWHCTNSNLAKYL